MKKTFIKISCILILSAFAFTASAQYMTGIGLRYSGVAIGLSGIRYLNPQSRGAADFLITSQYKGFCFTGLYEIHSKNHNLKVEVANVGLYLGLGAHVGSYKENNYIRQSKDTSYVVTQNRIVAAGLDAIFGVEWKLPNIPLLLSGDVKPFYDLTRMSKKQLNYFDYAVSLRWLF
jgi:hypothetical protein